MPIRLRNTFDRNPDWPTLQYHLDASTYSIDRKATRTHRIRYREIAAVLCIHEKRVFLARSRIQQQSAS